MRNYTVIFEHKEHMITVSGIEAVSFMDAPAKARKMLQSAGNPGANLEFVEMTSSTEAIDE